MSIAVGYRFTLDRVSGRIILVELQSDVYKLGTVSLLMWVR